MGVDGDSAQSAAKAAHASSNFSFNPDAPEFFPRAGERRRINQAPGYGKMKLSPDGAVASDSGSVDKQTESDAYRAHYKLSNGASRNLPDGGAKSARDGGDWSMLCVQYVSSSGRGMRRAGHRPGKVLETGENLNGSHHRSSGAAEQKHARDNGSGTKPEHLPEQHNETVAHAEAKRQDAARPDTKSYLWALRNAPTPVSARVPFQKPASASTPSPTQAPETSEHPLETPAPVKAPAEAKPITATRKAAAPKYSDIMRSSRKHAPTSSVPAAAVSEDKAEEVESTTHAAARVRSAAARSKNAAAEIAAASAPAGGTSGASSQDQQSPVAGSADASAPSVCIAAPAQPSKPSMSSAPAPPSEPVKPQSAETAVQNDFAEQPSKSKGRSYAECIRLAAKLSASKVLRADEVPRSVSTAAVKGSAPETATGGSRKRPERDLASGVHSDAAVSAVSAAHTANLPHVGHARTNSVANADEQSASTGELVVYSLCELTALRSKDNGSMHDRIHAIPDFVFQGNSAGHGRHSNNTLEALYDMLDSSIFSSKRRSGAAVAREDGEDGRLCWESVKARKTDEPAVDDASPSKVQPKGVNMENLNVALNSAAELLPSSPSVASGIIALRRKIRALLNKLTPVSYEDIYQQFVDLSINSIDKAREFLKLVFEKANTNYNYLEMYADLCSRYGLHLSKQGVFSSSKDDGKIRFNHFLMAMCEEAFKKYTMAEYVPDPGLDEEEEFEAFIKHKSSMIANVTFICILAQTGRVSSAVLIVIAESIIASGNELQLEAVAAALPQFHAALRNDEKRFVYFEEAILPKLVKLSAQEMLSSRIQYLLTAACDKVRAANAAAKK